MTSRILPNLGLEGGWDPRENGWGPAMNSNLLNLSVLVQGVTLGLVAAEPTTPAAGNVYLLDETHATHPNTVAIWDGPAGSEAWVYLTPKTGWTFYNLADLTDYRFDGTVWAEIISGDVQEAPIDGNQYARKDAGWSVVTSSGGGGSSGGAAAWTLIAARTITGSPLNVDFTDLGAYDDLLIYAAGINCTTATQLGLQLSTDNGASFLTSYTSVAAAGTVSTGQSGVALNSSVATGAISGVASVLGMSTNGAPKVVDRLSRDDAGAAILDVALAPVNAIRINRYTTAPAYFQMTGGTIYIWGRKKASAGSGGGVQFASNLWSGSTASTTAFAGKGVVIVPKTDIKIYGAMFPLNEVSGATYKLGVYAVDASNTITAVLGERSVTATAAATAVTREIKLTSAVTLTAGARYVVLLTRTDSTGTYALPARGGSYHAFGLPVNPPSATEGYVSYASNAPAVGTTVGNSGVDPYSYGLIWSDPAYEGVGNSYNVPFGFGASPQASEILLGHVFTDPVTMPANMAGATSIIGTAPAAAWSGAVHRYTAGAWTAIGTISVSTAGAVTFATTSGTAIDFLTGDGIRVTAPAAADTAFANSFFNFKMTRA